MAKAKPQLAAAPRWRSALKDEGKVLAIERFAEVKREATGVQFVASTDTPDRYGDTVSQDGWDLAAYEKNPVLLWAHDYSCEPVGKVGKLQVIGNALVASAIEFTPEEVNPFGARIGRMVEAGFLNTVSVGFLPTKWEDRRAEEGQWLGTNFTSQELLEISVTPVPANAEALAVRGFVDSVRDWASASEDDSPSVRAWKAEATGLVERARSVQAKAEDDSDGDAMLEMLDTLKQILEVQKRIVAALEKEDETDPSDDDGAELAKAVAKEDTRKVRTAFGALFTRR